MQPLVDEARAPRPKATPVLTSEPAPACVPVSDPRPSRAPSARWLPWSMAAVFFVLYAALSIERHRQMFSAGFDLGVFEQAIRAYAHGHAPIVLLKGPGVDLLGDHFSPIIATLAPFYRLWPSPFTLLVAQALLAALAIVPLTRWALAARGRRAALWTALGQGCSWGVVQMVDFDFHEVAFAVPLLAYSLAAAGQRRWRAAALWALPLVLVKEDLTLTVAVLGLYIASRGERRVGLWLAAFGAAAGALEFFVVLPALSHSGHYTYVDQIRMTAGGSPIHAAIGAFEPFQKWYTLFVLLAPTGFLALRSTMALLAVPTLAWRFLADNPAYWGTSFHYNAILIPIVFAAALDVLTRTPTRAAGAPKPRGRLQAAAMILGLAYTAHTVTVYPLHQLVLPSGWRTTTHTQAANSILARIPDGASVASTNRLAAQLVSRTTVSQVCLTPDTQLAREPAWVIVDPTDPSTPQCPALSAAAAQPVQNSCYQLIARQDGISLLRRYCDAKEPV